MTPADAAYRARYVALRRAALAHPRARCAVEWTAASYDAAAERMGDGTVRGWAVAAERLTGLASGRWDRVTAALVRVPVVGLHAESWRAIATEVRT